MTEWRVELTELLQRAGLEIMGDWRTEDVLPPRAAWRPVVAYGAEPTVAVRRNRPGLVAELNAQWHRLAVEYGIIGEDGVFLIDVAGSRTGSVPKQWTRVRLAKEWDLVGVLGERSGQPEFVAVSTDGDALLGATTEEYEVWLIAVDRVKEQQEEAARAAARETAEEREAAWSSLSLGPGPTERLRQVWADGLGLNPAASEDVLRRLLGQSLHFLWRKLPSAVVDAAVAHPEWNVRGRLAEAQPDMTAEQWTRLVLGEKDPKRRHLLAEVAADRRVELTEAAYEQLTTAPSARLRAEADRLPDLPVPLRIALAADPDRSVRASACLGAWPYLDGSAREGLLADPDSKVRITALLLHHEDHPMPRSVFDALDYGDQTVERCRLDRELAEQLSVHHDPARREALARNPHLDPDLVAVLAEDPDDDVRFQVSVRPELTEEQRASVRVDFDSSVMRHELPWVAALHDDPEAMRRCATSSHPLLRRSAARARHLPPDVVELLARDEDRVVRLFLAESCDDAPADMLLEVWRWWNGSLSYPGRPRTHPNFPRSDLLRYADDPHPRMRQLALDDPESTADLVERFSRDSDVEVRVRAATDPRLSAASAVRLLEDPRARVRSAAAMHPRLPARVLVHLLRDTDTAGDAARNPALPVALMHRMTDPVQPRSAP
ncbi:PE-PGRS family protein [Streptomyces sp. NBC_01794]|uniref:PE-PGRS family protein n=1 Tax=Streptomyces sp. NBC_01794 TaxID=2975942 RepID=UPI0030904F9F|nr:PE-PGRS family protein [Streptomyces sp. NBC_01794]